MNISFNSTNFKARIQFNNQLPKLEVKPTVKNNQASVAKKKNTSAWKALKYFISEVGVFIKKIKTTKSSVKLPS